MPHSPQPAGVSSAPGSPQPVGADAKRFLVLFFVVVVVVVVVRVCASLCYLFYAKGWKILKLKLNALIPIKKV